MKRFYLILLFVLIQSQQISAQSISQWRGPDRNGVFPETGLLKSWPEEGPELLWFKDGLDRGYSSVTVTYSGFNFPPTALDTRYIIPLISFLLSLSYPGDKCTVTAAV